jgi:hypothetical protein
VFLAKFSRFDVDYSQLGKRLGKIFIFDRLRYLGFVGKRK